MIMYNTLLINLLLIFILNESFFNLVYNIIMSIKMNKQDTNIDSIFCDVCGTSIDIPKEVCYGNYFWSLIPKRFYIEKCKCPDCNNIKNIILEYSDLKNIK